VAVVKGDARGGRGGEVAVARAEDGKNSIHEGEGAEDEHKDATSSCAYKLIDSILEKEKKRKEKNISDVGDSATKRKIRTKIIERYEMQVPQECSQFAARNL
jgi:hypothetical protein